MTVKLTPTDLTQISLYQSRRQEWLDLRAQIEASPHSVELNIGGRYYRDRLTGAEKTGLEKFALAFVDRNIAEIDARLANYGIEIA